MTPERFDRAIMAPEREGLSRAIASSEREGFSRAIMARPLLLDRTMTKARVELGKAGEDLACRELERRGYAIVARRWRQRAGEIDIIARDGETLVFVEVKARDGRAFGAPAEAVSAAKQRRIAQLAIMYLTRNRLAGCRCRFDVVSVDVGAPAPLVQVFQNAFDAAVT